MQNIYQHTDFSTSAATNFNVARGYEKLEQPGDAIEFYLQAANQTTDPLLKYEILLRCCACFNQQRYIGDGIEESLLLKAIALIPNRAEAYFLLSRFHEKRGEWQESYTISELGLIYSDWSLTPVIPEYFPGRYALLFQKGVAAWWVGLKEQSRHIMVDLRDNYNMEASYVTAMNNNLKNCGLPETSSIVEQEVFFPEPNILRVYSNRHNYYDASMLSRMRVDIPGMADVKRNFSQSFQDLFVLAANQGRRNGRYLEIGSAEPFYGNNTALLESKFGWSGVSIDINAAKVADFAANRKNKVVCEDATRVDYAALLSQHPSTDWNYLQIDCDPAETSMTILNRIPFDRYRFAVITFEHDYYYNSSVRDRSRRTLQQLGYELLVSDVAYNRFHSYEDWWVHPDLVDSATRNQLRDTTNPVNFARDYMFPKKTA